MLCKKDKEDIAKGEMQCNLYGHADPIPASALKGNCYSLSGAQIIEDLSEVKEVCIIKVTKFRI
jgi:hypothetical protein